MVEEEIEEGSGQSADGNGANGNVPLINHFEIS